MALTGCAGEGSAGTAASPEPSQTSVASPTATPVPTETPAPAAAATVTGIVVTPEAMQVTSSDESVVSFSYFDPIEDVVAALTAAFGVDPVVDREYPTVEPGPQTRYDWPGLRIVDEDWPATAPLDSNYYVVLEAPELNGVSLTTIDGIQIGDSALALADQYPHTVTDEDSFTVFVGGVAIPRSDANPRDNSSISVWVSTDNPERTITSISSPAEDYGV